MIAWQRLPRPLISFLGEARTRLLLHLVGEIFYALLCEEIGAIMTASPLQAFNTSTTMILDSFLVKLKLEVSLIFESRLERITSS